MRTSCSGESGKAICGLGTPPEQTAGLPWDSEAMDDVNRFVTDDLQAYEISLHPGLGLQFAHHRALLTDDIRRSIESGTYELAESRAAENVIRPSDIVLEMGGGLGLVAAHVFRTCRPASYFLVEANPFLLGGLHHTLRLNGVTEVIVMSGIVTGDPAALARGWSNLNLWYEFWGSSTRPLPCEASVRVPVIGIAEILARLKPTVLICDIEGGEGELIRSHDLRGVRSIILEIHPNMGEDNALQAISGRFAALGFDIVCGDHVNIVVATRQNPPERD